MLCNYGVLIRAGTEAAHYSFLVFISRVTDWLVVLTGASISCLMIVCLPIDCWAIACLAIACWASASALATLSWMACSSREDKSNEAAASIERLGWRAAMLFFWGVVGGVTRLVDLAAIRLDTLLFREVGIFFAIRISPLAIPFSWRAVVGASKTPPLIVMGWITLSCGFTSAAAEGSVLIAVVEVVGTAALATLWVECSSRLCCSSCLVEVKDLPQKHLVINLASLK